MKLTTSKQERYALFIELIKAIKNHSIGEVYRLLKGDAPILNPFFPDDFTAVHYASKACFSKEILTLLCKKVDLKKLYQHPKGTPWQLSEDCSNRQAIYSFFIGLNTTTTTGATTSKTIQAITRFGFYSTNSTRGNASIPTLFPSSPPFQSSSLVGMGAGVLIGLSSGWVHVFFEIVKKRYPGPQEKRLQCRLAYHVSQVFLSSLLNTAFVFPFSHATRLALNTNLSSALIYGGVTLGLEMLIESMAFLAEGRNKKRFQSILHYAFILIPLCLFFLGNEEDSDNLNEKCFALVANLLVSFFAYEGTRQINHRCFSNINDNSEIPQPALSLNSTTRFNSWETVWHETESDGGDEVPISLNNNRGRFFSTSHVPSGDSSTDENTERLYDSVPMESNTPMLHTSSLSR